MGRHKGSPAEGQGRRRLPPWGEGRRVTALPDAAVKAARRAGEHWRAFSIDERRWRGAEPSEGKCCLTAGTGR